MYIAAPQGYGRIRFPEPTEVPGGKQDTETGATTRSIHQTRSRIIILVRSSSIQRMEYIMVYIGDCYITAGITIQLF